MLMVSIQTNSTWLSNQVTIKTISHRSGVPLIMILTFLWRFGSWILVIKYTCSQEALPRIVYESKFYGLKQTDQIITM